MTGLRVLTGLGMLVLLAIGAWLVRSAGSTSTHSVRIQVEATMGDEPLELGRATYPNPGGEGRFEIRDFQFFLSNVALVGEGAEYREPDSYHLVRFDDEDGRFEIDLVDVPRADYTHLEFAIGVDSAANGMAAPVGDLDPNGRMAWGWEIGYKFVLVEGGLDLGDRRIPLVYHVGFDENYRQVRVPIDDGSTGGGATIRLCANLLEMFDGAETIDMSEISNVTSERSESRLLADNYAGMVSRCP